MTKCDNCGSENFFLLTRQNPKGQKGIFHCEQCTGTLVDNVGEALVAAIQGEAQEPANTEITIRCTNCGLEFESDYDLEQNLIDLETGEIHDGCPTCKTDAYLMDLIKYPDLEPAND